MHRVAFLHILTSTTLVFLTAAILTGVRWYLSVILSSISLTVSDAEHLFTYLLAILHLLLKNVFKTFADFLIRLFRFFAMDLFEFLTDFEYYPLSDTQFANIFSHSIDCLFILLIVSFDVQSFLICCNPICLFCLCFLYQIQKNIISKIVSRSWHSVFI